MVFFCQKSSFTQEYRTQVVSCKPAILQLSKCQPPVASNKGSSGALKDLYCHEVVFEDTVFFPEGGGQPDDRGMVCLAACSECGPGNSAEQQDLEPTGSALNISSLLSSNPVSEVKKQRCPHSATVLRVIRRGCEAVHYLDAAFPAGAAVLQTLDWQRREDHMQQHSAQHLLSAVAERVFGARTTSWCLGPDTSSVELATNSLSPAQQHQLEDKINAIVAAALPVTVTEYGENDMLPPEVQTRGLPADHVGVVRVVSIGGVDANLCCGTHVSNTAQLQTVKLLTAAPGKRSGSTCVTFVAGTRLRRYMRDCHSILRALNPLLNTGPEGYVETVSKIQSDLKTSEKTARETLRDLAVVEAKLLLQNVEVARAQHSGTGRVISLRLAGYADNKTKGNLGHREKKMEGHLDATENGSSRRAVHNDENLLDSAVVTQSSKIPSEKTNGTGNGPPVIGTSVGDEDSLVVLVSYHRRLADLDYLSAMAAQADVQGVVLMLTAGEDMGPGVLLLTGPQHLIRLLGPRLCEVLEGRGGGKTRFSARVSALHRRAAAADAALHLLTQRCTC
ncbi:alanyl-tRNA editing protein Aarsd1 [Hyalella azteca]|uniref:Alanyl-tRNA editing protein Aarsd1 n=1 Tax=Hyalella azteca TaxID=294128 RepID=A0A8B7NNR3_HYAAZ|nr:alanyl-tRNA editing protein Aarsd1 [Hyalella azteca]